MQKTLQCNKSSGVLDSSTYARDRSPTTTSTRFEWELSNDDSHFRATMSRIEATWVDAMIHTHSRHDSVSAGMLSYGLEDPRSSLPLDIACERGVIISQGSVLSFWTPVCRRRIILRQPGRVLAHASRPERSDLFREGMTRRRRLISGSNTYFN